MEKTLLPANGEVFLKKTENRGKFVKESIERFIMPKLSLIKPNSKRDEKKLKILIKPNIVSKEPYPTTTHPDVLRTTIEYLYKKHEVVVADAPAVDSKLKDFMYKHPLKEVCDQLGVPFINLYNKKFRKMKGINYNLSVSTFPLEFDMIISLPVLKVHKMCSITGALKNQFGYFSGMERVKLHALDFSKLKMKDIHRAIAEVNKIIKTDLFIVDAIKTLSGAQEKRWGGKEKELGYMLSGEDPVALDSIGLELLKKIDPELEATCKEPEDVKHIRYSIEIGLGKAVKLQEIHNALM